MYSKRYCIFLFAIIALSLSASVASANDLIGVLVIDSGSDFTHEALKEHALACQAELNGTPGVDDSGSGFADDVYGWNFVENNAVLVNLDDTPPEYERVLRCMELLGLLQAYGPEGMTEEDYNYLITQYQDQSFWRWVEFVGGWAHGTHCAGTVILNGNTGVGLKAIKHLPTGNAPRQIMDDAMRKLEHIVATDERSSEERAVPKEQLIAYFDQLAQQYIGEVQQMADYIGFLNPRLINCSYGTDNGVLVQMMEQNMARWGYVNPSAKEVQEMVNLFVERAFLPRDKAMFAQVDNALIFIAAGNNSENLDPYVCSPNSVPIENKIVIGATDQDLRIAPFSDYGINSVDVAVPGVNIYAAYPNQQMGYMSGTSMASPMAVKYASRVLQERPSLSAVELKKILMETVDKKDWLRDKVRSGGVINVNRAMFAARQMNEGKSIDAAIKIARDRVSDRVHRSKHTTRPDLSDPMVRELYFSIIR